MHAFIHVAPVVMYLCPGCDTSPSGAQNFVSISSEEILLFKSQARHEEKCRQ